MKPGDGQRPSGGAVWLFWIVFAGLISEGLYIAAFFVGDFLAAPFDYFRIHLALSAVYAVIVYRLVRPMADAGLDRRGLWVVLGFALLFRLTLAGLTPTLSDDIYRYVWDGNALLHGVNPYRYPPGAQALAHLRDEFYPLINHKDIGTPYTPLTEMIFASVARFVPPVTVMKAPFVLFDFLTALVLVWLLKTAGRPAAAVVAYAWNPLVIFEIAGGGHADSVAVFFVVLMLALLSAGKKIPASLALAGALLSKYFALAVAPAAVRRFGAAEWALALVMTLVFYIPFLPYVENHVLAIYEVASTWTFNDSVYALAVWVSGSTAVAKALCGGAFLAVFVFVCFWKAPAPRAAYVLIGAMLLLSTTVHPWYLVWIAPFLCLYANPAWLWLTVAAPLSYLALAEPGMAVDGLLRAVVYGPFVFLLALRFALGARG